MNGRIRVTGRALAVLSMLLVLPTGTLDAQQRGQRGPRGPGVMAPMGPGATPLGMEVGVVLRHRDALAVTDAQVEALEALRARLHEDMAPIREAMEALRGSRRGERPRRDPEARAEMRERLHDIRDRADAIQAPHREAFESILTEAQREELKPLLERPGRRGPRGRRGGGGR